MHEKSWVLIFQAFEKKNEDDTLFISNQNIQEVLGPKQTAIPSIPKITFLIKGLKRQNTTTIFTILNSTSSSSFKVIGVFPILG